MRQDIRREHHLGSGRGLYTPSFQSIPAIIMFQEHCGLNVNELLAQLKAKFEAKLK